jgi:hypothetical protein
MILDGLEGNPSAGWDGGMHFAKQYATRAETVDVISKTLTLRLL